MFAIILWVYGIFVRTWGLRRNFQSCLMQNLFFPAEMALAVEGEEDARYLDKKI